MKIKCNLSNLDKAIKQIEDYRKYLQRKQKLLMERLAEIGINSATISFQNALYAGVNDVVVEQTPTWIDDNKLVISAHGSSITFIEFGTGITYTSPEHPKAGELGFTRGGYGKGRGKRKGWGYYGEPGNIGTPIKDKPGLVFTRGNPASRSMYDAGKQMREQITTIAKEIFND